MVYHQPGYFDTSAPVGDIEAENPAPISAPIGDSKFILESTQFNPYIASETEVSLYQDIFEMPAFSNALQGVPKSLTTAMPARMKFDHVYSSVDGSIFNDGTASSEAVASAWIVRANGMFEPETVNLATDRADRGLPMNYDQFKNLYDQYTVINSEIRVDAYNRDPRAIIVGITPVAGQNATTAITKCGHYEEMYGTVFATCIGAEVKTIHNAIAPHKFLGRSSPLSDKTLAGEPNHASLQNPTEALYWHIWAHGMGSVDSLPTDTATGHDAADLGSRVSLHVTIRYSVIWHEPRNVSRSGFHSTDKGADDP